MMQSDIKMSVEMKVKHSVSGKPRRRSPSSDPGLRLLKLTIFQSVIGQLNKITKTTIVIIDIEIDAWADPSRFDRLESAGGEFVWQIDRQPWLAWPQSLGNRQWRWYYIEVTHKNAIFKFCQVRVKRKVKFSTFNPLTHFLKR